MWRIRGIWDFMVVMTAKRQGDGPGTAYVGSDHTWLKVF